MVLLAYSHSQEHSMSFLCKILKFENNTTILYYQSEFELLSNVSEYRDFVDLNLKVTQTYGLASKNSCYFQMDLNIENMEMKTDPEN